jgi:long-subunit acyl-CoA synthetase (AMP-forming)/heme oxygenase
MSSVLRAVAAWAQQRPDGIAVIDGETSLTFKILWQATESLAANLNRHSGGEGPVAICMENSPLWVLVDLVLITLARLSVPLPSFFTAAQRDYALAQTGARLLIADRPMVGHGESHTIPVPNGELYIYPLTAEPVAVPDGTGKITYTSGTTGQPKGVCLSQAGMERVAQTLVEVIGTDYAGIHCAILPLAVLLENVAGLYTTLLAGGLYYVPPSARIGFAQPFMPDFGALVQALTDSAASSCIMVPEILRGTLAALTASGTSLPAMKLVAVGGAKVSQTLLDQAEAQKLPVFQGYGLSEMASVVALNTPRLNRPGSIGQILPHVELKIARDGEIQIHNPTFLGYVGAHPLSSPLLTGDIGRIDEDGYLYIDGRKSHVLITAFGRNVSPEWVESELLAEPAIGQAMVFGDGAPALGALIVPSSAHVPIDAIVKAIERANARLPDYARVKHWTRVMPFTISNRQLTGSGRMRRAAIYEAHRDTMNKTLVQPGQYLSFFERLVIETEDERRRLQETSQIRDALRGTVSRVSYIHYLTEAYHHVKHTVNLMRLADSLLSPDKAWLRDALQEYIVEETGHEEWILEDIRNAGGNADAVRQGEPRMATELMVSYAYDYVGRINPVGFFGMVFVLEGTSTQLAQRGAEALMQSLDLPESCFHYLLSHGALDLKHMQFFQALMDRLDEPEDQAAVIHVAKRMFILFANVFSGIPHAAEVANGH